MKTTRAIVQPLLRLGRDEMTATCKHYLQVCPTCHDGTAPTEYTRTGRATYVCDGCGRDVSLAVIFLSDAEDME